MQLQVRPHKLYHIYSAYTNNLNFVILNLIYLSKRNISRMVFLVMNFIRVTTIEEQVIMWKLLILLREVYLKY